MTRPPRIAVYPGSFDPVTRGHEDIARRSLRMADHLIVAVAHTSTQKKKGGLFDVAERIELLREVFSEDEGIEVASFQGLLVDFCRDRGAHFVIRGMRAVSDFEYEFQMAQMNRELWSDLETVFLTPDVDHSFVSASLVREVARLGGDVSTFVSPPVLAQMRVALAAEE